MNSIGIWFVDVHRALDAGNKLPAYREDEIGNIKLVEIRNFRCLNIVVSPQ